MSFNNIKNNLLNAIGRNQLWGFTPARNLILDDNDKNNQEINILLAGMADLRHILLTTSKNPNKVINYYIVEESFTSIARDMLLLLILCDENLGYQNRIETFLEIYGNIGIRKKNVLYIKKLSEMISNYINEIDDDNNSLLNNLFDISNLKFKEKDQLDNIIYNWKKSKNFKIFDLWDNRLRKHYGNRYDVRDNLIDWDYHMNGIKDNNSIIHIKHYRHWRNTGIAFPQRDCEYNYPNYTMATEIDAIEKKKGNIKLRGIWNDIIISPYISFGIESDNQELFIKKQDQHVKNSFIISEYNLLQYLKALDFNNSSKVINDPTELKEQPSDVVELSSIKLLNGLKNIKIHILPNNLIRLIKKKKFYNFFNIILLATSQMHLINQDINILLKKNQSKIYIETINQFPFKKNQKELYINKIDEIANICNWSFIKNNDQNYKLFSY